MSEFLPASLLPVIAGDLRISEGTAGQAVSVTAFAAALSALLISVRMPRTDRRRIMIGLTLLAAASNLLAALTPSLAVLSGAGSCLGVARRLLGHDHRDGLASAASRPGRTCADRSELRRRGGDRGRHTARDMARRRPRRTRRDVLFAGVVGVGMLVMHLVAGSSAGLFVGAAGFGFGFGFAGVPTTMLTWGVRDEPARLEQVSGLIVMVCNVGIAAGATVGGVPMDGVSASAPLVAGGVAVIAGTAQLVSAIRAHRLTLDSRGAP